MADFDMHHRISVLLKQMSSEFCFFTLSFHAIQYKAVGRAIMMICYFLQPKNNCSIRRILLLLLVKNELVVKNGFYLYFGGAVYISVFDAYLRC